MECIRYCCCKISPCCCPKKEQKHFQPYRLISSDTSKPLFSPMAPTPDPVSKIPLLPTFKFQQPRGDLMIHPQIISGSEVVSKQPEPRSPITLAPVGHRQRAEYSDSNPSLSDTESSSHSAAVSPYPQLQFSLYYDIQRCMLTVHLQKVTDLQVAGFGSKRSVCNPFVVMLLYPNKEDIFESSITTNTLNPHFDEMFEFKGLLPHVIRTQTLIFRIYNHSRHSKDTFLGMLSLPLEDADLYGVPMKYRVNMSSEESDSRGDLSLSLTYKPRSSVLQLLVLKATNLQISSGPPDPYVKVRVLIRGRVRERWKTQIKRNSLVPVFNEGFQFSTAGLDLSEISLRYLVMNYCHSGQDEQVGVVNIGCAVESSTGRCHWEEMLESPDRAVSRWHVIERREPH